MTGLVAALAGGCGEAFSEAAAFNDGAPVPSAGMDDGDRTIVANDASAAPPLSYRGNPLCRLESTCSGGVCCMPDDDGQRRTDGTAECATPLQPGEEGGVDASARACRVGRSGDDVALMCTTASWAGEDGASCERGEDCAPGFDCIATEGGKTCRHYCCLGGCKTQTSQNGGSTFCDVQRLADVDYKVPVCMPVKRCKLLSNTDCASNETCAIVNENGEASCVTVGDRSEGESCDTERCGRGLTCLGQPGARKCHTLCRMDSPACLPSQTCNTSALFEESDIGICQ